MASSVTTSPGSLLLATLVLPLALALTVGACSKKKAEDESGASDKAKAIAAEAERKLEEPAPGEIDSATGPDQPLSRTPEAPTTPEQAMHAAKKSVRGLGMSLKKRLLEAMSEGGPSVAIQVCADEAQIITAKAQTPGLRVGRSSLRLRNPKNGEVPAWVKEWLTATGERKAKGLEPVEEVVDGTARFLMPIALDSVCQTCHGAKEQLAPDITKLLAERYPEDRATGFAPGDLRGVMWAEVDVVTE